MVFCPRLSGVNCRKRRTLPKIGRERYSHYLYQCLWVHVERIMNKVITNSLFCCLTIYPFALFAERTRSEEIVHSVGIRHLEYVDIRRHERPMVLDVYIPRQKAVRRIFM